MDACSSVTWRWGRLIAQLLRHGHAVAVQLPLAGHPEAFYCPDLQVEPPAHRCIGTQIESLSIQQLAASQQRSSSHAQATVQLAALILQWYMPPAA